MVEIISFTKIASLVLKIKEEYNFNITEIELNDQQMDSLIEDEKNFFKYDKTRCLKCNSIYVDNINITFSNGPIRLKREKK